MAKITRFGLWSKMGEAKLIEGVQEFFSCCQSRRIKTYIVSHKTEYANYDPTKTNLRSAALNWMQNQNFFDKNTLNLSIDQVYFESTRAEKIQRIASLGCTHFIDDLEETFLEKSFPNHIQKILYAPHQEHSQLSGVKITSSWKEINEYLFNIRN